MPTQEAIEAMLAEAMVVARRRASLATMAAPPLSFEFRGAALELQTCESPEIAISGPSETGKTVAALYYLDRIMWRFPGAQAAIVRKRYVDMPGTVLLTFEKRILGPSTVVRTLGKTKPERYIYPNESTIWIGGMDNPGKVLSGERDIIYINQGEELLLPDYETITTRATGRAGNIFIDGRPWSKVILDCNPAHSRHWILQRAAAGSLKVLQSFHKDNPLLYDANGNITEQGKRTIETLSKLTGVRSKRLLKGLWTEDAEGALWQRGWIDTIAEAPKLFRIIVAVDPSGSRDGAECGIIAVGAALVMGKNGRREMHLYVLADASIQASSDVWGREAVALYHKLNANLIVAEGNFGGDMVRSVIKQVQGGANVPVKLVTASRGKAVRAEPISVLYSEGRGHHVGSFPVLEDELCNWVNDGNSPSPNRLDALVWGGTELIGSNRGAKGT